VIAGVVPLGYLLLAFPPWLPNLYMPHLDGSWVLGLNALYAAGETFGRDVVFTFGPYGLVYVNSYFPGAFGYAFAVRVFLAVVAWVAALGVARRYFVRPGVALAWMAAVIGWSVAASLEAFVFGLAAALLLVSFSPALSDQRGVRGALVTVLALAGLIKFTFMIAAATAVGGAALASVLRRRVPWEVPAWVSLVVLWWVAAGQPPGDLPLFIGRSLEVAGGYSAGMSTNGYAPEIAYALAVMTVSAAAVLVAGWRRDRLKAAGEAGAFATLSFLAFKAGFVRHDGHVLVAATTAVGMMLWYFPACWRVGGAARLLATGGLLGGLAFAAQAFGHYTPGGLLRALAAPAGQIPAAVQAGVRMADGTEELAAAFDANMAAIRAGSPLPTITGTVDVYPWAIAVPVAWKYAYRPRPVFQSYQANTPTLAELNADHLRGPDAPETVLFDVQPIDAQYPSLADGPSWLELLSRYDVRDAAAPFVILDRRATPVGYALEPLVDMEARVERLVSVPTSDSGWIWAVIDMRETFEGRVLTAAFKPPYVAIDVRTRDGARRSFRLVPGMAAAGFLLSPVIDSRSEFALLLGEARADASVPGALAGDTVTGVRVSFDTSIVHAYRRGYRLRLYRIRPAP
jgi:hypothetical protein